MKLTQKIKKNTGPKKNQASAAKISPTKSKIAPLMGGDTTLTQFNPNSQAFNPLTSNMSRDPLDANAE